MMSESTQTSAVTTEAPAPPVRNAGYFEFGYAIFMILFFVYIGFLHRRLSKLEREKQS